MRKSAPIIEIRNLTLAIDFSNAAKIKAFGDWEIKICFYADARVSPSGITSLKKRLDEGLKRYSEYRRWKDLSPLARPCYQIEKQIQKNCKLDLSEIMDEPIEKNNNQFLDLKI